MFGTCTIRNRLAGLPEQSKIIKHKGREWAGGAGVSQHHNVNTARRRKRKKVGNKENTNI